MRNMLSDKCGRNGNEYDIVFVDVPYINNNYTNRELEEKMIQYRNECEHITSKITNKKYKEKQIYYSMGLLCLSSYLKKHINGIKIGYVHYYLNYDEFDTLINNTKVVAFSTMTITMQLINALIRKAKKINPNVLVILGGYHVSFCAKETLKNNPMVDYVILKEGERALLALFEKKDIDYIEGIAYRNQNNDIQINDFFHYLNPEEIPSPDYSLIDKHLDKMNIQLSTMRGCIGCCNFCVNNSYWKSPRLRDVKSIVAELQFLKSILPKGTIIHIIDNIFTLNENHLKNILEEMIQNNLLGYFFFECDTLCSCIDSKKISLIEKIGVIKICLGIEDSNDDILENSNKKVKFSDNIKAAILLKNTAPNICIYTYWIIGLPGSTIRSLKSNLLAMKAVIEKGIIDIISPKVFIPYPGSVFYDNAVENGINELSTNWELYERREPPYPYKYKEISQNDLYQCLLDAFDICHSAYEKRFGEK
ncbi:MAG: B12-binding domain-containing radical SAM protein [Ruminococcus flavefaciens]|nr:B12-binding domain-containing radical SAM protein [Ruminococcus flavefaciens]